MTLAGEAIARYHKLIESEPYIDLAWAQALQERKKALKLDGGPLSPVLRPHFLSNRDYVALTKASETLLSAIERMQQTGARDSVADGAHATAAGRADAGFGRAGI